MLGEFDFARKSFGMSTNLCLVPHAHVPHLDVNLTSCSMCEKQVPCGQKSRS